MPRVRGRAGRPRGPPDWPYKSRATSRRAATGPQVRPVDRAEQLRCLRRETTAAPVARGGTEPQLVAARHRILAPLLGRLYSPGCSVAAWYSRFATRCLGQYRFDPRRERRVFFARGLPQLAHPPARSQRRSYFVRSLAVGIGLYSSALMAASRASISASRFCTRRSCHVSRSRRARLVAGVADSSASWAASWPGNSVRSRSRAWRSLVGAGIDR